jgi:hypothetical protein
MKELTLGEMESTPPVTQHRSRIGDFPAADGDVSRAVCCAGAVERIKSQLELRPIDSLCRRNRSRSRLVAALRVEAFPLPAI